MSQLYRKAYYNGSATELSQLPEDSGYEVAFAGRSNAGKSSAINCITGISALARTSKTPGRTQMINFFSFDDQRALVDLPGYGYAKVSKTQRDEWTQLIFDYLRGRPTLRCVFILIDSRHGLKDTDIDLMKMLDETAVQYRIILTKTDKVKSQELAKVTDSIVKTLKMHAAAFPEILATSAQKNIGLDEARTVMASYAA